MSLKGKTAVITGSNSGIGLGVARELAKIGVNVVLNSFTDDDEDHKLAADIACRAWRDRPLHQRRHVEILRLPRADRKGWRQRYPDQQRRHPARRPDRRISRSKSGTRSSRSTCRRRFHTTAPRCR